MKEKFLETFGGRVQCELVWILGNDSQKHKELPERSWYLLMLGSLQFWPRILLLDSLDIISYHLHS